MILGFLARRKGYEVALAALRELPPEYVLVAAGGAHAADHTDTEAWLRAEAERLGVAERFQITGFLSEEELEAATALAESKIIMEYFRSPGAPNAPLGAVSLAEAKEGFDSLRQAGIVSGDVDLSKSVIEDFAR